MNAPVAPLREISVSRYGAVFVVTLGLLSLCVGNVAAQRQGFIAGLGGGLGFQSLEPPGRAETHVGLAGDLKLGSQIGRSWQVYFRQMLLWSLPGVRYPWFTSLTGIGTSYKFPGTCVLATGSVGFAWFGWNDDGWGSNAWGPGFSAGLGCEVSPHFILDLDVMPARVDNSQRDNLLIVRFGISVLSH
jgi:hypothetical protein